MGATHYVLLGALALLLVVAAVGDWRHRIIENWLNLAIMLGAPLWWWANGSALWPDVAAHVAIGAGTLVMFSIFFALGAMGGGDVKLIAALSLWFPLVAYVNLLVAMAILGGVLTVAMMVRQVALKIAGQPEVPYGIAISVAGLLSILRTIS
jgi:prepilin peptidase CpaA